MNKEIYNISHKIKKILIKKNNINNFLILY